MTTEVRSMLETIGMLSMSYENKLKWRNSYRQYTDFHIGAVAADESLMLRQGLVLVRLIQEEIPYEQLKHGQFEELVELEHTLSNLTTEGWLALDLAYGEHAAIMRSTARNGLGDGRSLSLKLQSEAVAFHDAALDSLKQPADAFAKTVSLFLETAPEHEVARRQFSRSEAEAAINGFREIQEEIWFRSIL